MGWTYVSFSMARLTQPLNSKRLGIVSVMAVQPGIGSAELTQHRFINTPRLDGIIQRSVSSNPFGEFCPVAFPLSAELVSVIAVVLLTAFLLNINVIGVSLAVSYIFTVAAAIAVAIDAAAIKLKLSEWLFDFTLRASFHG